MKKTLTLVPVGGLANRIYAITSAIGFCKENNIKLKILWYRDWGMGAGFHQILRLSPEIRNVEIIDAKWYHYIYDRPRKKNLWIPYLWQFFAFDKKIYEKDVQELDINSIFTDASVKSLYMIQWKQFYTWKNQFNSLLPVENIEIYLENQKKLFNNKHVMGIHIRRVDNTHSIANSPLALFINKIKDELQRNPKTKFYVASDSREEKQELKELFGEAILMSSLDVRRDTKEGIMDALVELYMLSFTSKIYGSYFSSYSLLAAHLSDIPIEILVKS